MFRHVVIGAVAGVSLAAAVAFAQQPPRPTTPQAPAANQPVQGVSDTAVLNQKIAALEKRIADLEQKHANHFHVLEDWKVHNYAIDGKTFVIVPVREGMPPTPGGSITANPVFKSVEANKGVPTGKPH
jgi:hypothetical protein